MPNIFYSYEGNAYVNLTNKCNCHCSFCVRNEIGTPITESDLWLDHEPSFEEALSALKLFHLENYAELVFCGYGEPTYALEVMLKIAGYVKENYNIKIRLNTNGLGNIVNGKNIVPEIAENIDAISISLNAASSENYDKFCKPAFNGAYEEMLSFTKQCSKLMDDITLSVVSTIGSEEIEKCREIAENLGVKFRVRQFIEGE